MVTVSLVNIFVCNVILGCAWSEVQRCQPTCTAGFCQSSARQCMVPIVQRLRSCSECELVFRPVCVQGQTFDNACQAECRGYDSYQEGKCCQTLLDCWLGQTCEQGTCQGKYLNRVEVDSCLCDNTKAHVCVSGQTFSSPCKAQCKGHVHYSKGKCCAKWNDCESTEFCDLSDPNGGVCSKMFRSAEEGGRDAEHVFGEDVQTETAYGAQEQKQEYSRAEVQVKPAVLTAPKPKGFQAKRIG
jgi:hypothetical protein